MKSYLEFKQEGPCRAEGKILRQLLSVCHITIYHVALFRMAILNTLSIP